MPPRTELQLRAGIAEENVQFAVRTGSFAEKLRVGSVSVAVTRTAGIVERTLAVTRRRGPSHGIELDTAKAFVAVLDARPVDSGAARVMLELSPREAEWSAALLTTGLLALGQIGRVDEASIDALISAALGGASREDLLTRFVLTGGKGIDGFEGLSLDDDDVLDRIQDLLNGHSITELEDHCASELRGAARGAIGRIRLELPKILNLAPIRGVTPNHGRPGTMVVLNSQSHGGAGWPATQPNDVAVVFTSNRGTSSVRLSAKVTSWSQLKISVIVPSGVGVGPVGFVWVPPAVAGDAPGRSMASALSHCGGVRGGEMGDKLAHWAPPAISPAQPGLQPSGVNLFTGGPQITAVQPLAVHAGDTLVITGHEFVQGDSIAFIEIYQPSTFVSDISLTAAVPVLSGGVQTVRVVTPTNDYSNALNVTVLPTLTSLSHSQIIVGEWMTATGSGFEDETTVTLNGANMLTTFVSGSTLTFKVALSNVPVGGQSVQVMVTNPYGNAGPLQLKVLPGPLWGWADLHTHPMINLAFGGKLVHGGVDADCLLSTDESGNHQIRATSIDDALGDDRLSHGGWDASTNPQGDDIRHGIINGLQNSTEEALITTFAAGGYPNFDQWPKWNDVTHQKMWFEWIRRARDGGLRVMVALATNNKTLGDAVSNSGDGPTDDKRSADLQIFEIKQFVGRHADFLEIALSAADTERIVRAGKTAVVLGVEIDNIGNFSKRSDPAPTHAELANEIQRLYLSGVRYILPVHVIDNLIGGTAIYSGGFNASNLRESGFFWHVECSDATDDISYTYIPEVNFMLDAVAFGKLGIDPFRKPGPRPVCPPSPNPGDFKGSGHRNALTLTEDIGVFAIKEMMRRGMIVDIDHMSQQTADATLDLAESFNYPIVSGHSGIRGEDDSDAENSRTPTQLARISKLHGMFGLGSDGAHAYGWTRLYQKAATLMGYKHADPAKAHYKNGAVAFGTDLNGLVKGPRPGGGGVLYDKFSKSTCGNRTWDYNTEGVAHYGMLVDFIDHVRDAPLNQYPPDICGSALVDDHLFRTADYFWHMWETIEAKKANIP